MSGQRNTLHVHLDVVGGIAGDMFVAAMLDAFPDLAAEVTQAVAATGMRPMPAVAHIAHNDGVLAGSRFDVSLPGQPAHAHQYVHQHPHQHSHQHVHWAAIRNNLLQCALPEPVKARAIDIFQLLAEAEARVHGTLPETVSFHEVGAWDSIADIVAAACLIERIGASGWSVGSLPQGGGRVATAHGELPVPAPATAILLEGFDLHDDGIGGERVTPTGAAILRYLSPSTAPGGERGKLARCGYGFGTRRLPGLSNVLRAMCFETASSTATSRDVIGMLSFEVDDQTPEDLAVGLERIRSFPGVVDVTQATVTGKHGRATARIQVLARPGRLEEVAQVCFAETTTIGIRVQEVQRVILNRSEVESEDLRVKIVRRPQGMTAKADISDVAGIDSGHAGRTGRREAAETAALLDKDHDH